MVQQTATILYFWLTIRQMKRAWRRRQVLDRDVMTLIPGLKMQKSRQVPARPCTSVGRAVQHSMMAKPTNLQSSGVSASDMIGSTRKLYTSTQSVFQTTTSNSCATRLLGLQARILLYKLLLATSLTLGLLSPAALAQDRTIYGASLGPDKVYLQGFGDTWYATWADDGDLYVTSDDTSGFDGKCRSQLRGSGVNVSVNRLHGNDPTELSGESVNCLDAYDVWPDPKNNVSWKTTGILSLDGTLYLVVEQDTYEDSANLGKETARDATIIKSTDHGKTWSGSESESAAQPMFHGTRFGAPSFIQYGRDGTGGVDGGETYVYAISNDGSWDNGDSIVLGRVRRSDLSRLRGEDWEFYSNGHWSRRMEDATPVLQEPGHLGNSSSTYIPALHKYILASWYYPNCTGYAAPGCDVHRSRWVWYQASKPWGPWTKFWEPEWYPDGYYNPILVNKFLAPDGESGWIFTAGYFWDLTWYRLIAAPFVLDLTPRSMIDDSDLKVVTYEGKWTSAKAGLGDYGGDLHYTTDPAARATLQFQGTGVRVLTDFAKDMGVVEIYLDGRLQGTASANFDSSRNNTRIEQRVLWSVEHLKPGKHTLQLRKLDGKYFVVDGFVVLR